MSEEPSIRERLVAVETDLAGLREESRAVRNALHGLIATAINEHARTLQVLSAAQQHHAGIWWTVGWVFAILLVLGSGAGWLIEHNVQITIKP